MDTPIFMVAHMGSHPFAVVLQEVVPVGLPGHYLILRFDSMPRGSRYLKTINTYAHMNLWFWVQILKSGPHSEVSGPSEMKKRFGKRRSRVTPQLCFMAETSVGRWHTETNKRTNKQANSQTDKQASRHTNKQHSSAFHDV